MKQVLYVPGKGKRRNTLSHIATKCGKCDGYVGEIGGQNPKEDYVIRPEPRSKK